jgi:hypothetical protein
MANYPTTVFAPAARSNGQTIDAGHVNDLQGEVSAIETALINGLAHDLKFTDATYDIGKSGATRPRDFFLSRNAVIGGTLLVTGVTTLGAIDVGGSTVRGNMSFNADNTYDIGASGALRPRDLHVSRNGEFGGAVTIAGVMAGSQGVAMPAGGAATVRILIASTANFGIYAGSGAPAVSAAKGSLYLRTDGSAGGGSSDRAYINTDGGTTWTAITTAA